MAQLYNRLGNTTDSLQSYWATSFLPFSGLQTSPCTHWWALHTLIKPQRFSVRLGVIVGIFQVKGLENKSSCQRYQVVFSDYFFLGVLETPSKEPSLHRFTQKLSFGISRPRAFLAKTLILALDSGHLDSKQVKNKWGFNNPAGDKSYTPKGPIVLTPTCWKSTTLDFFWWIWRVVLHFGLMQEAFYGCTDLHRWSSPWWSLGTQHGTFSAQLLKQHDHRVCGLAWGRRRPGALFQWTCPRHQVLFSQPVFSAELDA